MWSGTRTLKAKLLDFLLALGAGLLLATIGVGSFWLADKLKFNIDWIFWGWVSLGFIASVGWSLRNLFRSASFIAFFSLWLVLHIVLSIFVLAYLSWLYWLPSIALELWIGYALAYWLFGAPPKSSKQRARP